MAAELFRLFQENQLTVGFKDKIKNIFSSTKTNPATTASKSPQPQTNAPLFTSDYQINPVFASSLLSHIFDGEKFPGGYTDPYCYEFVDYWTLRQRSVALFTKNIYAAGLIRRLITNIINTGLTLEATPANEVLGFDDDFANDWSENTEILYRLWSNNPNLVDWKRQETDGAIQATAKRTALLSGDCLVVLRTSRATGLPVTELIDGRHIQTPIDQSIIKNARDNGREIKHGVEIDKNGRHVAFYVRQKTGAEKQFIRIPANGPKSGRKIAWLVYGTKRLLDDVRGMPLLALVLQSLNEIDKYRDSEQRAAAVNAFLAMFVKKTEDKPGTKPFSGGAVRRETATVTDEDGGTRDYKAATFLPGMVIEELGKGEEPISFDTKRPNVNFAAFETAIVAAIAWANEIPPETLQLLYQSNYSASRMASSEFTIFIDRERKDFADQFCIPRYKEWLVSMVLTNRIQAEGLLEAWRDITKFQIYEAWSDSDWSGAIKPHVDPVKEVNAKTKMVEEGFITRDRAAKELSGMKFTRIVKQLSRENELLQNAQASVVDSDPTQPTNLSKFQLSNIIADAIEEKLEQLNLN